MSATNETAGLLYVAASIRVRYPTASVLIDHVDGRVVVELGPDWEQSTVTREVADFCLGLSGCVDVCDTADELRD